MTLTHAPNALLRRPHPGRAGRSAPSSGVAPAVPAERASLYATPGYAPGRPDNPHDARTLNRTPAMNSQRILPAVLLLAAFLLAALPARAQTGISFEFANVETTASGVSFDVVATAAPGARLGDAQVYLDYNDAFGELAHENGRLSATLGSALAASGNYYEHVLANDNTASRVSLVAEYVGAEGDGIAFGTAPVTLFHVEMAAVEGAGDAAISFDEGLMEGQQFADDFATAFPDVVAVDLIDLALALRTAPVLEGQAIEPGTVRLAWTSAQPAARFVVEHAEGFGGLFQEAARLDGATASKSGDVIEHHVEGLTFGTHRFRISEIGPDGRLRVSEEIELDVEMADEFVLEPAFPNPFNPQAVIRFAVKEASPLRVELYNALGQRVMMLFDGTPTANTYQDVVIDGSNLASGLYIVRVQGASFVTTQKVTLLK